MPLTKTGKKVKAAMTKTDRAYLAGILDGEGCIGLARRGNDRYITPTVQVTNTDRRLIEWIQKHYGGYVHHRHDGRLTRKPVFGWFVAGQIALSVIRDALPYLKLKRAQADVLLSLRRYQENRVGWRLTDEDVEENRIALANIHQLNRRGIAQEARIAS